MKTLLSEMEYHTCKFISDGSELRSFLCLSQNPEDDFFILVNFSIFILIYVLIIL